MKTEKEKMLAGELYDPLDQQLSDERLRTRLLIKKLNDTREDQVEERSRILKELIPDAGAGLWLQPPFYCDYGTNMVVGERVFFNFNCVVLDVMQVSIGSRSLFGPNVQIYTATHPMNYKESIRSGVCQTYQHRGRRLDWRKRSYLPGRNYRRSQCNWCWQCSYKRYSCRCFCSR